MNLPVVYRRAALAEFADAAEWYHRRRAGLGTAFVSAVESIIDRVAGQPDFYPEVYSGVREALVPGFPYCVYYQAEAGRVVVMSVFHTSRDPTIWQARV